MHPLTVEFSASGASQLLALGRAASAQDSVLFVWWCRLLASRYERRERSLRYYATTDADPVPGGILLLATGPSGDPQISVSWKTPSNAGWEQVSAGRFDWMDADTPESAHIPVTPLQQLIHLIGSHVSGQNMLEVAA